jgi:hypothetical protein
MSKDLEWWRQLNENDKEWMIAYDIHLKETEFKRFRFLNDAITESSKKKNSFAVIGTLLNAIFRAVSLKAE